MANKDPSDIIIIIRRSQNDDFVCQSDSIPVANYTSACALFPTPITDVPVAVAVSKMKSIE